MAVPRGVALPLYRKFLSATLLGETLLPLLTVSCADGSTCSSTVGFADSAGNSPFAGGSAVDLANSAGNSPFAGGSAVDLANSADASSCAGDSTVDLATSADASSCDVSSTSSGASI